MIHDAAVHPYASEWYARAFGPSFAPVYLASAQTWVLTREIRGTDRRDVMGCYPICSLSPSADLTADAAALRALGYVSLVLVTDPFVDGQRACQGAGFELCRPYKQHHVHDYAAPFTYGRHHRYEVKRAAANNVVEVVRLSDYMDDWLRLYGCLVERHKIEGIQNFPRAYVDALAKFDGMTAVAAFVDGSPVTMHLWLEYDGRVYSHLGASSEDGYRSGAAYAIYDHAIQYFAGRRLLSFGGAAGVAERDNDGLSRFKSGFANSQATSYLCGKILDEEAYLALAGPEPRSDYFPSYRDSPRRATT